MLTSARQEARFSGDRGQRVPSVDRSPGPGPRKPPDYVQENGDLAMGAKSAREGVVPKFPLSAEYGWSTSPFLNQCYVAEIRTQVSAASNLPAHVTGKDGMSYLVSRKASTAIAPQHVWSIEEI